MKRRPFGAARAAVIGCLLLAVLGSKAVPAHERSESFSNWHYSNGELHGLVTVRSREVTRLTLPGEGLGAGDLTPLFIEHVSKTVAASVDGTACVPRTPFRALESEPGFIRLSGSMACPPGARLALDIGVFFGVAPAHHHFVYVESQSGARREGILTAADHVLEVDLQSAQAGAGHFGQFVAMGIEHIATGIDHLAFLAALLIAARSARQVLTIVTGFTLGHSVTLSLAVFGVVQANRGAVESLIGLTIALAAARNLIRGEREGRAAALGAALIIGSMLFVPSTLRPDMPGTLIAAIALAAASAIWRGSMRSDLESIRARFMMALGFGSIHGLGFAGALQDLHLPQNLLVETLIGFNMGVEIGQLAAVVLAAAAARALAMRWPAAAESGVPATVLSAGLLAVGTAWFLSRAVAWIAPT